jgi:butyryl-CoA dehydrogenase
MDFSLSKEQAEYRDRFRDFAELEIAPAAEHIDRSRNLPPALLEKAAAQGMLGPTLPKSHGGAGLDYLTYVLLVEQIARHCLTTAAALGIHNMLSAMTVHQAGNERQKAQFLPRMAGGELGTFALTEPEAGSDPGSLRTRAVRNGDEYILDGVKSWVTNGGSAGVHVVFALTSPGKRHRGISAFVVDTGPGQMTPGFQVGHREPTLGMRGLDIRTVYLNDCRVPADNLLGEENQGWPLVIDAFNRVRLSLAAAGLGAAEGALDMGVKFAVGREQFGTSIAHKQAVQTLVADSSVQIEALRHLVFYTAWLADTGQEFGTYASMAKYLAARVANQTADKMVQVLGGCGFSDDSPVSRVYRDVRGLRLLGGTDEIQRYTIARRVFDQHGLRIQP